MRNIFAVLVCMVVATIALGQQPPSGEASSGPKDDPMAMTQKAHEAFELQIAQLIEQARQTYPDAKQRFLNGLPLGYKFFVTILLKDKEGHKEQVFVRVNKISDSMIIGAIANDVMIAKEFKAGQSITVSQAEIIDWTIVNLDGIEEGNLIGKLIDSLQGKESEKK